MNKAKLLKIVNPIIFLLFIIQVITSLILFFGFKIPDIKDVVEIHEYNGLILIVMIIIHVFLNWDWIKVTFLKK